MIFNKLKGEIYAIIYIYTLYKKTYLLIFTHLIHSNMRRALYLSSQQIFVEQRLKAPKHIMTNFKVLVV